MKKFYIIITSIIALLIFAILMCYIFTSTILGSILTSSFGAKTTVNNTIISTNFVKIYTLKIRNPTGTKHRNALKIKTISIYAPLTNYLKENLIINEIILNDLMLDVEILPGNKNLSNWDQIISHIQNSKPSTKKSNSDSTVKLLQINNLKVRYTDINGKTKVTNIKNLTFKNLSTKNGDITSQIAKTILMRMIFNAKNLTNFPLKLTNQTFQNFFQNLQIQIKSIE